MDHALRITYHASRLLAFFSLWGSLTWPAGAADPVGFPALRLDHLPLLREARAGQFSSCDPTGGNNDQGHYLSREGAEAVLAEVKGPGCLYRIWSANPSGQLRLYFEGENTPRVDVPFAEFLSGQLQPFAPFCSEVGGAGCSYFPFPFRRGCRVTVANGSPMYYQVTYHTFPPGTPVRTFAPPGEEREMQKNLPFFDLDGLVEEKEKETGFPSQSRPSVARKEESALAPGKPRTLFESHQPGTIRAFTLSLAPSSLTMLRGLILRMYWDGETQPSVECPLADFFAAGLGRSGEFSSCPVSHGGRLTFRFPMPYHHSARLTLTNRTQKTVYVLPAFERSSGVPRSGPWGLFHAQYREATTVAEEPYVILEAQGRGHYIGTAMVLLGQEDLQFLEGDERIWVDGETKPSLQGTGTEDYFNGGWYFLGGPFATAFAGAPVVQAGKSRIAAYRWQVSDCVPFRKSIRVELEHGPQNDAPGCTYHSVAFWYQTEPHLPFPPLPPLQPLPPFREPGVLEGEDLGDGKKEIRDDSDLPQQASGGHYARFFFPTKGSRPGPVSLRVPVREAGVYDVQARVIVGVQGGRWTWDWGPKTENRKGKKESWRPQPRDTWEVASGVRMINLGRVRLAAGSQPVSITPQEFPRGDPCSPGWPSSLDLDYLQLQPVFRVKGAQEGEELKTLEASPGVKVAIDDWTTSSGKIPRRWSPQVVSGRRHGPADWSGGAQARIVTPPGGGSATFALPVPERGMYALVASFTDFLTGGRADLLLDGQPLGPSIDTSPGNRHGAGPLGSSRAVWEVDHRVGLGVVSLKAGSHRLTVKVHPSLPSLTGGREGQGWGPTVGLDYLLLKPILGGYEGEDLVVCEATSPVLIQERFGAEPRWSGGAFLRFAGRQVGDRLTVEVPFFHRGRYVLKLGLARRPNGGQVQLFWDGKRIGKTLDSFHPVDSPASLIVGEVRGKRGPHQLSVEVVGRNEGSGGFEIGLDEVELEAQRSFPGEMVGIGGVLLVAVFVGGGLWIRRKRAPHCEVGISGGESKP